jgi:hypothetical protein
MDNREFVEKMLRWEELTKEIAAIEADIKAHVLELETTQTIGNVSASYYSGRTSYDYKTAAQERLGEAELEQYAKVKTTYDYRSACKDHGIEDVPSTKSDPSVSVKLLEDNNG